MKWRYRILNIVFGVMAFVLVLKLGYLQIIKAWELSLAAKSQRQNTEIIPSNRGEIKSSDSFVLATSLQKYKLQVDTRYFPKENKKYADLMPLIGSTSSAYLYYKISDTSSFWFSLLDDVSDDRKREIDKLKVPGLVWESNVSRWYPEASISAHLLGFVGKNEQGNPKGYFGLEGYYDRELNGFPGKIVGENDVFSKPILLSGQEYVSDIPGSELITSIDRSLQFMVYQKLRKGLDKYQAVSGTISIMEPSTGRIMAMVSLPDYDPNKYTESDDALYRNPLIADAFEPGSTFKVIVMASALDAGVVDENTKCNICQGPLVVADSLIKTWNDKYYAESTMTEVIQHSDNVGMVFVGRRLGKDKLLNYFKKFGFGTETGIDLQEETGAPLRPPDQWYELDVAASTFGQGIAVTPLQMLRAVGAIANKGIMMTPRVVDVIAGKKISPKSGVKVISQMAAAKMSKMMINSVDRGEAKWAKPSGFVIAGKTGTAQIPVSGHYDKVKTIASFIGFAPADDPKFVMLVTLREPKTSPWGSETAAPLWFELSRDLFRYFGLVPD